VRLSDVDDDCEFRSGTYLISEGQSLYINSGVNQYGDPVVQLMAYVNASPNQEWKFTKVPGGFTILNLGTGQYASDVYGELGESSEVDHWAMHAVRGGFAIRNARTGLYLTDPGVQEDAIKLTEKGTAWQFSVTP
jgi:hypothetical protein